MKNIIEDEKNQDRMISVENANEIVLNLEKIVFERRKAENRDFQHELPDEKFSEVVPYKIENEIIEAMFNSDLWIRRFAGWDLNKPNTSYGQH